MNYNPHDVQAVSEYLLSNAKRCGQSMRVGDIYNNPGNSINIDLHPQRAGLWIDYANPSDSGNLVTLWATIKGVSNKTAYIQIQEFLGNNPSYGSNSRVENIPTQKKFKPLEKQDWRFFND